MHLGTGGPKHECPKPGDTVCYWRSHGIKRLRMAAAQTHGVLFECRRTLACRAGHRKCARSAGKLFANQNCRAALLTSCVPFHGTRTRADLPSPAEHLVAALKRLRTREASSRSSGSRSTLPYTSRSGGHEFHDDDGSFLDLCYRTFAARSPPESYQIGRASCRERV